MQQNQYISQNISYPDASLNRLSSSPNAPNVNNSSVQDYYGHLSSQAQSSYPQGVQQAKNLQGAGYQADSQYTEDYNKPNQTSNSIISSAQTSTFDTSSILYEPRSGQKTHHHPDINVNIQRQSEVKSRLQSGDQEGYITPYTKHTMHENEVLKTPKKHERIQESELSQEYEYDQRIRTSERRSAKSERASLEPYRKSAYPEFGLVEDLPDRSFLLSSINDMLQTSHMKESLIAAPTKVSIMRNSTYSPAKIQVEYLLKEKYEDGSVYEGEGRRGLRHGKGTIYYQDGTVFDGEFFDGKMSGYGELIYPDGKICYRGEYHNDKFEGQGLLYNETPVELVGPFDYRDFNRLGNYWLKYDGKFKNDMKSGVGTLHLINGERIYGEFQNDRVHGKGTFYVMDGSTITGRWEDNKLKEQY